MTATRRMRIASTLILSVTLAMSLQGVGHGQDEATRAEAALAEEQALLRRQLRRLRDTMDTLANRFEAEGRVNAAKLLRAGLEHLDLRDEESGSRTIDELMDASKEDIRTGRTNNALEEQQQIISHLEHLLDILMDRRGLENLDEELEKLREIRAALSELAQQEQDLQGETEQLRNDSANEAQQGLQAAIAKALEEQRQLLAQGEQSSRESGLFDLEQIRDRLDALIEEQELSTEIFGIWTPEDSPKLEAIRPALERARSEEARAERMDSTARDLELAAERARESAPGAARAAEQLEEGAERQARAARASQDPAAEQAAKALAEAARAMSEATTLEEREEAAAAAERRAEELATAAEKAREAASRARSRAREQAEEQAAAQGQRPTTVSAAAERVAELAADAERAAEEARHSDDPEGRARAAERARSRTEEALEVLDQGLADQARMGEALEAAQAEAERQARSIEKDLKATAERSPVEGADSARQSLGEAAEAMQRASQAAGSRETEAGRQAAREAGEALQEARAALEEAMQKASQGAPQGESARQERRDRQEQLAAEVGEMREQASEGSMGQEAQASVEEALATAQEAMQKASGQMSTPGQSSKAARSQREAIDALEQAARQAEQGVEPQTEAQQRAAEELAQKQREIREQLLNLARRNEERESPLPQPKLDQAAQSALEAEQSLSQGNLDQAQAQEQKTEQEIRDALKELEEEEEQYQRLRQEELLFRMAEEIDGMLEMLREQMRATVEVHVSRAGQNRLSRANRIRLRNISREFSGIAQRSTKIREALEEEGVIVFSEVVRNIETDLGRISRDMGDAGGYQSGERIQALQEDVEVDLTWLAQALKDEIERRAEEEEKPPPPPGSGAPPRPPLVPDVAELKLLRRMELEVLERLGQFEDLHPELADVAARLEPLLLEDLSRLAYQHNRIAELFTQFRKKLGIPSANGPPDPGADADDGEE